ncbi:YbaB/EbfC family nucleoid-associated protein [Saccharopolyspora phatthalungensis]|uniref:DNA-binding protein YbaB n=1 Tax=Saccharopolyspora phatthalungensis TaxID=664693 RepID=A0A840PWQ5_9PSEU|nr:YbaB/EbfC family nucleoid-associated protein [Saccharopolyspora phatthalungensis]MBB5152756.1 DNA-binding protein YbaB [Saccharopolyspora phatthalungensis]
MSGASERIQEMMRKFQEQAQKASELQSAMQDMRGTASSPDRSVTVTVAPSGALLDLRLAPNAVRQSASDLQQQIMATIREATANAAEQLNSTVAPILGDQFDKFQEAFNVEGAAIKPDIEGDETPSPESPAPPPAAHRAPPATPRRNADYDDDDFSAGSFLR